MGIDYVDELPREAELITDRSDIEVYLSDYARCVDPDDIGSIFVDFTYADPVVYVCEEEFPGGRDYVYEVYPENHWC